MVARTAPITISTGKTHSARKVAVARSEKTIAGRANSVTSRSKTCW